MNVINALSKPVQDIQVSRDKNRDYHKINELKEDKVDNAVVKN